MGFETPLRGTGVVCALAFTAVVEGGLAEAATIAVPAGGDVQAAINAAQPGDVITLAAGATYVGNFVLPNKGASTTPIVIRSSAADSQLPRAGVRITPSYAPLLAKLRSPNSAAVLRTASGAHHWTLMFLEFQANLKGNGDIIQLGAGDSSQAQLSGVPYKLTVDRIYMHGDPALGQKRGISLNSADTTIKNSFISDCKAVGQDAQAINGFNGPGPYLIENNYLEGAAETIMFGGSDPVIPNLVPSNITVRGNYITKPLAWRNPIINPPASAGAAAVPGGGSLAAGTYAYKVVARRAAGMNNVANSVPTAEASATLSTAGAITISWSAVAGAENYVVYGRTAGGQNTYWITTALFFTDTGAAGTAGTPPANGTRWAVKNLFELKNAQDVLIEGNVFENLWIADQTGYAIGFTPRNQDGRAPWSTVQRITFRNNLVRHSAGGVNILGRDSPNVSQQTNHITIQNNVFDDLTAATWGSGSRFLLVGGGADSVVVDHNTINTTNGAVVCFYGLSTPDTNFHYTNNMSPHNSYGVLGDAVGVGLPAINAYLPGAEFARNVLAGGNASNYPTGNYFPTLAAWQAQFVDFAGGNYRLLASSPYKRAGTDGKDLGADVDAIAGWVANATSGDNSVPPGGNPVQIVTSSLPNGMYGKSYAQTLQCSGGSGTCAWALQSSSLPSGLSFDEATATVWGTPTAVGTGSLSVSAWDALQPSNTAQRTLSVTVDAPKLTIAVPAAPAGQVGVSYRLTPSAAGALGTVSWSVTSGSVPAGLAVDPVSGTISGVPVASTASSTFVLQASDDFASGRTASAAVTITIAPAPPPPSITKVVSLTPSVAYPIVAGTTVTWTAVGSNNLGPVEYKFYINKNNTWVLGRDWSTNNTFTWATQPADAGSPNYIQVWVRAVGSTASYEAYLDTPAFAILPAPLSLSSNVDFPTPPGNQVTWTATLGTPPASPVEYKFQVVDLTTNSTTLLRNYSSSKQVQWAPQTAGRYAIQGFARAVGSSAAYDVSAITPPIDVTPTPITIKSFTTSTTFPATTGTPITFTLRVQGGMAGPLQYVFWLYSATNGWRNLQPWGPSETYTWTPTSADQGDFAVQVSVRSNGSTSTYEAYTGTPIFHISPASSREIVLYAATAAAVAGSWSKVADSTAAGGFRIWNPDAGAAKLVSPLAAPANYFELTFNATAGVPYHLWIRGRADANYYGNDSVFVQFSGSVNAAGAPINRIGTTAAAAISIEDGSGAGLSGWGWQDDAYGALAQPVYFATSGTQKIRVQQREDGISIDQIVLSSVNYLSAAPGATKNDSIILAK
jgi:hypothetical protein